MKCISFLAVAAILFITACNKDNNDNATINGTDAYFMEQASYSNYDEISAGTIAAIKGSTDSVKIFGSMMVADHTVAQASLDSLATTLGISVPTAPDSLHLVMAAELQNLSGYQLDTTYIGAQVRDHQTTVSIFEFELSNGNNQAIKDFANKNLPIIQMHLQEALNIQQEIQ